MLIRKDIIDVNSNCLNLDLASSVLEQMIKAALMMYEYKKPRSYI